MVGIRYMEGLRVQCLSRAGWCVSIHKDDVSRLSVLAKYFTYDGFNGMRELQSIEGWKLVYASQRPTKILVYPIDQALVGPGRVSGEAGVHPDLWA